MNKKQLRSKIQKKQAHGSRNADVIWPEEVTVSVRQTGKIDQDGDKLYRMVYTESLPEVCKASEARTQELLEKFGHKAEIWSEDRGKVDGKWTNLKLELELTHEVAGASLGSEFMGWSPLGSKSLVELLMIFVEKRADDQRRIQGLEAQLAGLAGAKFEKFEVKPAKPKKATARK